MQRFGLIKVFFKCDVLSTLNSSPSLHEATNNRKSSTLDLQQLEDVPRLFIQTEDTYLRAVFSPAVESPVTFSFMSLKPVFRAAMSLDLPGALPSLVEARYKSCQAASKLIFTPSEVTILHTKSGLPVRGMLCTAMRKISINFM
jgi:hypothetical protein